MTTEESNKIIALFDGAIINRTDKEFHFYEHLIPFNDLRGHYAGKCHGLICAVKDIGSDKYFLEVNSLKYHSSWDWLMPVWVKFRTLNYDYSNGVKRDDLKKQHEDFRELILGALEIGSITMTFKYISEAIQWYNSQSKTIL